MRQGSRCARRSRYFQSIGATADDSGTDDLELSEFEE